MKMTLQLILMSHYLNLMTKIVNVVEVKETKNIDIKTKNDIIKEEEDLGLLLVQNLDREIIKRKDQIIRKEDLKVDPIIERIDQEGVIKIVIQGIQETQGILKGENKVKVKMKINHNEIKGFKIKIN